MKKTTYIQLVLITAALAGCDRPLYQHQQGPEAGDRPDSSNSCPLVQSVLPPDYYIWYSGLRPFEYYYGDGFNLDGYYAYRYPLKVVRAGFGRTGNARIGSSAHS